ncbi:MAG TPA: ABC transporter substrate-binding protein, partial [Pelolinea sp.]|nr:ABC transporter substrate-binding protein [Pelolinea sp.]
MRSKLFAVFSAVTVFAMLAVSCGPSAGPAGGAAATTSKDPTTWVETTFGEPQTLDPSLTYETGGGEILQNTMDTLVFFKKDSAVEFVPFLATEVPSAENGGISADGKAVTFKIREGVAFHDGTPMTVEDVAFTFWRNILAGGTNSPQWMMTEPVYGAGVSDVSEVVDALANGADLADPASVLDNIGDAAYDDRAALGEYDAAVLQAVCEDLKARIVPDEAAGTVTFNLAQPWAPFLGTLAGGGWGAVQSKAWVSANGGWDGDCASWTPFYGWSSEEFNETPLGLSVMGTGPYKFDHWTPGEELVLTANENYWMSEPAWEGAAVGPAAIKTIIIKIVDEFSTRLAMAQAGDADNVLVGSTEDWPIVDELVGVEGTYAQWDAGEALAEVDATKPFVKVTDILVLNNRTDVGFQFKIETSGGNTFMGSGKLDGDGIPATFFQDAAVRRAFNYCFDYDTYLADVVLGEGVRAPVLMLPGMSGYDENAPQYTYDIEKCQAELEASYWTTCTEAETAAKDAATAAADAADVVAAYAEPTEPVAEGEEAPATLEELQAAQVEAESAVAEAQAAADACEPQPLSEVGFRLSAVYNTGNTQRQTIAEVLQAGLQEAGEQYVVEVVGLPWPTFLSNNRARKLPIFIIGWLSDYYDTHNWSYTFTAGYYSFVQRFPEDLRKEFVAICTEGVIETDPVARDQYYKDE